MWGWRVVCSAAVLLAALLAASHARDPRSRYAGFRSRLRQLRSRGRGRSKTAVTTTTEAPTTAKASTTQSPRPAVAAASSKTNNGLAKGQSGRKSKLPPIKMPHFYNPSDLWIATKDFTMASLSATPCAASANATLLDDVGTKIADFYNACAVSRSPHSSTAACLDAAFGVIPSSSGRAPTFTKLVADTGYRRQYACWRRGAADARWVEACQAQGSCQLPQRAR